MKKTQKSSFVYLLFLALVVVLLNVILFMLDRVPLSFKNFQKERKMSTNFFRMIPDFPKPGIQFKDISVGLLNVKSRNEIIESILRHYQTTKIDKIVGIDSRGFIFGSILADRLQKPFIMFRKPSKLPGSTKKIEYKLEYGQNQLEAQSDCLKENECVLIIDDILATGGTLLAAYHLIETEFKAKVSGICCVDKIDELNGFEKILQETGISCFLAVPDICCLIESRQKNLVRFFEHHQPQNHNDFESDDDDSDDNKTKTLILCCPEMESMAQMLRKLYPGIYSKTNAAVKWDYFPDGYPNITFPAEDYLRHRNVLYLMSLSDHTKILEQLYLAMVLPRQQVKHLDIWIPYFGPGTMDRVEKPGVVATAECLSHIISQCMPLTETGPSKINILDIHNPTNRFFFKDNIQQIPHSFVPVLIAELRQMYGKFSVCFPDDGSYKRARSQIPDDIPMIVCHKTRNENGRDIMICQKLNIDQKDFDQLRNFPSVIIDDLVQSGGTLEECRKLLKVEGIPRVSCFVTHPVFPNKSYLKFLHKNLNNPEQDGFDIFFISDTIPRIANIFEKMKEKPFRILRISPFITTKHLENIQNVFSNIPFVQVFIASASKLKNIAAENAVKYVFGIGQSKKLDRFFKLLSFPCQSGVREQPIGKTEIMKGAYNRLNQLKLKELKDCLLVSMENGIVQDDEKKRIFDTHFVCMSLFHDGKQVWENSGFSDDPVEIDSKIYEEFISRTTREKDLTIGKIYMEKLGYEHDNWQKHVCGKNRAYLLKQTIAKLILEQ